MSALARSAAATSAFHRVFEDALVRIDATIRHHFRAWTGGRREEALAEARAATWAAWHGLLRRGRDPRTVGVTAIAANACRSVKNGRRLGANRSVGHGAMDIHHPRAQSVLGIRVVPLEELPSSFPGNWQDWLSAGDHYGPGDEAAFRIDFTAWLARLPARRRRAAELLAEGQGTAEVARRLGVTSGAVSQTRRWLAGSWREFQGEPDVTG